MRDMITELLERGVSEIIDKKALEKKLRSGKKLRIKFGIDPTGDVLHLGHSVALLKLKEFQDMGHTIIFLIGDHTAEIGDPSGRNKERVPLSKEQIKKNMASYCEQASRILNLKKVEVRHNSEWYDTLSIMEFGQIASHITIQQLLHRADFKKRLKSGGNISAREALYPLLQGYDSVMLKCDVELGGGDQKFNLLMGRQIQKRYGNPEQDIIMISLLEGTDGSAKMSKTANNYIALTDDPALMYGKLMSIPDALIGKYFELTTRIPLNEIHAMSKNKALHPRDAKMRLGREVVTLYHGKEAAEKAEKAFIKIFQKKERPDEIPHIRVQKKQWNIVDLLVETKLAASKGEARRLVDQGGVVAGGKKMTRPTAVIELTANGTVLQKGKRHFVRVIFD